eukprot:gene12557-8606_t
MGKLIYNFLTLLLPNGLNIGELEWDKKLTKSRTIIHILTIIIEVVVWLVDKFSFKESNYLRRCFLKDYVM